jgi:Spy/CpxP family protein refolding chaperone
MRKEVYDRSDMNKFFKGFACCLLSFVSAASSMAQERQAPMSAKLAVAAGPESPPACSKNEVCKGGPFPFDLALSEDQMEQWMDVHDKYAALMVPKDLQLKHLRRVSLLLLTSASLDKEKIKRTNAEIAKIQEDLSVVRDEMMLAHAEILTPEQRKSGHSRIVRHMSMPPMMMPLPPQFGIFSKAAMPPMPMMHDGPPLGPPGPPPSKF